MRRDSKAPLPTVLSTTIRRPALRITEVPSARQVRSIDDLQGMQRDEWHAITRRDKALRRLRWLQTTKRKAHDVQLHTPSKSENSPVGIVSLGPADILACD